MQSRCGRRQAARRRSAMQPRRESAFLTAPHRLPRSRPETRRKVHRNPAPLRWRRKIFPRGLSAGSASRTSHGNTSPARPLFFFTSFKRDRRNQQQRQWFSLHSYRYLDRILIGTSACIITLPVRLSESTFIFPRTSSTMPVSIVAVTSVSSSPASATIPPHGSTIIELPK